jgi:hypothetical protein
MTDGSSKAIIAMFVGSLLTCVGVWYGGRGHKFLGWCAILSGGFVVAFGTYSLCISLTESAPASFGSFGVSAATYGRTEDAEPPK